MNRELVEAGCECIQQLLSIIEEHIHWDDFSFEEQEDYWYFKTFYRKVSKYAEEYQIKKHHKRLFGHKPVVMKELNTTFKDGFLAGFEAARQEKIHDLRKNPKDLPEENQEVLVLFTLPDKSKNDIMIAQFENNDFNFVDLQDVIAWCEIPTFEE